MLTWEGSWPNSLVRRPPWLQACSVKNKTKQFCCWISWHSEKFICFIWVQDAQEIICIKIYLAMSTFMINCCSTVSVLIAIAYLFIFQPKLYISSTLNIDLILWHTQLIRQDSKEIHFWVKRYVQRIKWTQNPKFILNG